MSQIYLKLINEKLSYVSDPPYITSGNKNLDTCKIIFDENWNLGEIDKYLYIIKNNEISGKVKIDKSQIKFPDDTFDNPGDIYFSIMAIDEDNNIIKTSSRLKFNIKEGINKDDIIKQYPEIKLYRGCASVVKFDFSNFQFYNGKVELTIKRTTRSNTLFTQIFNERKEYKIIFDSEFTGSLNYSDYLYDLVYISDDEQRYPLCVPSKITVMEMVNNG